MSDEQYLEFLKQQHNEHQSWLSLVEELRAYGVGDINAGGMNETLHTAIVKWGEELAELRRLDPNPEHGQNALAEKREM